MNTIRTCMYSSFGIVVNDKSKNAEYNDDI